jgi:trimeric autotransporter adhesin
MIHVARLVPLTMVLAGFLLAEPAWSAVRHVNASAGGANNGTSWTDAFQNLQSALAAANPGDEIWVAAGVYRPGPPGDAVSSFVMRPGVGIYGGFVGTETQRAQRDWLAHPTTLSGDIGNDDTVDNSPFAPPWPNNVSLNTSNSGHVVEAHGVAASAVLDGFHVVKGAYGPAGTPAGDALLYASGVYCVGGSPTIRNCKFADNFAAFGHGGAVFLWDSNASITQCSFYHNLAYQGSGGAIYVGGDSAPTLSDCTFTSNMTVSTYGQTGQGGAIQLDTSAPVTIERCVFDANIARPFGGGTFEVPRGGAISSYCINDPTTTIRECVFRNNQAPYGGGLVVWNPTTVLNCVFDHNTATTYESGGNTQGGDGAGIAAIWTDCRVINTTVADNIGQEAVGIAIFGNAPNFPAEGFIFNTIVWGNVALGQDVSLRDVGVRGNYTAEYSCIQHLFTADPGEDPIDPENYPGCIAVSPRLVNAAAGDLRLLAMSPCIDAARNSFVPSGTALDLDGRPRFYNDPAVADTGVGPPPIVDMGAYERQPQVCPGDVNGDLVVDLADLAVLLGHFGITSGATRGDGDLNGDGAVNLSDLAELLGAFGASCG